MKEVVLYGGGEVQISNVDIIGYDYDYLWIKDDTANGEYTFTIDILKLSKFGDVFQFLVPPGSEFISMSFNANSKNMESVIVPVPNPDPSNLNSVPDTYDKNTKPFYRYSSGSSKGKWEITLKVSGVIPSSVGSPSRQRVWLGVTVTILLCALVVYCYL